MFTSEDRKRFVDKPPKPSKDDIWFDKTLEVRISAFLERLEKSLAIVTAQGAIVPTAADGSPLVIMRWQRDIIIDVFCWQRWSETRQRWVRYYDEAYVEIPRQNGKSIVLSIVAIIHLFVDMRGIEIYSIALDEDQANAVFETAKQIIQAIPWLDKHCDCYKKEIKNAANGSKYGLLPGDAAGFRSKRPTVILFDELLTQKNRDLYDAAYGGMAARVSPVIWQITTAGTYGTLAYEQHERAVGALDGSREEPSLYAVVYGLRDGDDHTDRAVWERCNPSMGVTVDLEFLERKYAKCQGSPAALAAFRKEHLNDWSVGFSKWLNLTAYEACEADINEDDYRDWDCFVGVDLAATTDTTAMIRLYKRDTKYALFANVYLPSDGLEQKAREDSQPYPAWRDAGLLTVTTGSVTDHDRVKTDIDRIEARVADIGFDRAMSGQVESKLTDAGYTVTDVPQGAFLHDAIKEFERLLLVKDIAIQRNPLLKLHFSNVVVDFTDQERMKVIKKKKTGRIDAAVASLNGLDRAMRVQPVRVSKYESSEVSVY